MSHWVGACSDLVVPSSHTHELDNGKAASGKQTQTTTTTVNPALKPWHSVTQAGV